VTNARKPIYHNTVLYSTSKILFYINVYIHIYNSFKHLNLVKYSGKNIQMMRRGEIKTNFGKRRKIKYQGGIKKKKT